MPEAAEKLVINTGPLVALGRVDALGVVGQLDIAFVSPQQVADEIAAGTRLGHPVEMPTWVEIVPLTGAVNPIAVTALDAGEAAVIRNRGHTGCSSLTRQRCLDDRQAPRGLSTQRGAG